MSTAGLDGPLTDALVGTRRFFTRSEVSADHRSIHATGGRSGDAFYRDRWSHDKVVRSTHGVNCTGSCSWKVYVKDGIITWEAQQTDYPSTGADRPEYEPRGLPARCSLQLVHLLAHPGSLPLRARRAPRDVPRGQARRRWRPGRRLGLGRAGPREGPALQVGPWQGRPGPLHVGGGRRDHRGRPRLHGQALGPRPDRGLLADPRHVAGLLRLRRPLPRAHRRADALVLRLVRRPAQRLAADVRRPDRRARVGRLVGCRLPHHVGLQRPDDPHPRRALDDRGALPRPEGRRRLSRLRRERQVRRRVGRRRRPAPTARSRWRWGTSSSRSSSSTSRSTSSPTTTRSTPTCPSSSRSSPTPRMPGRSPTPTAPPTGRASTSWPVTSTSRRRRSENAMWKPAAARRPHRRGRDPARFPRLPLRRRGDGQVEPRAR